MIENFQTTSHAPEALYRLTESSLALGIPNEAKKYAAVLGANYPGNEWYEKAFELIQDDAPAQTGRLTRTPPATGVLYLIRNVPRPG